MLRVLAAFPIDLPKAESAMPFQPVAVEDIAATIAWLADHDGAARIADAVMWDLMQPQPATLGGMIEQFRRSFGTADMAAHYTACLDARSRRQARRSRELARLGAADAHHGDQLRR